VRDIRKVVVIGAGISGLACAFRLRQLGIPVLILEASAKAGGVISTVRRNGYLFEAGPQCPRFPKSVWTLIRELGLQEEFIAGDSRAKRYILGNGELHRAPFSADGLLTRPARYLRHWPTHPQQALADPNSAALISVEVRLAGKGCCSRLKQFVAERVPSQEPYTAAVTRWPENQ
jgi:protoporphyrinogen oxidase